MGILYNETGKLNKSKKYFNNAYQKAVELKDTLYIAKVLGNMGNMYMINGEHEKALKSFNKVLEFFEKIDNKKGLANV